MNTYFTFTNAPMHHNGQHNFL